MGDSDESVVIDTAMSGIDADATGPPAGEATTVTVATIATVAAVDAASDDAGVGVDHQEKQQGEEEGDGQEGETGGEAGEEPGEPQATHPRNLLEMVDSLIVHRQQQTLDHFVVAGVKKKPAVYMAANKR
jgi:hypothetical protein